MGKTDQGTSEGKAKETKSLSKVSKAKKPLEINRWMVIDALNQMNKPKPVIVKGHSLAAIRGFIKRTYGLPMSYPRQELLKQIIENEFIHDRINMSNYDGASVNFTKRFEALVGAEEVTEPEETDATTDEDEE